MATKLFASSSESPRVWSLPVRLFASVDIAALVYFRIAFGALMLWEVIRYFENGWITRYYVEPSFHFTYYGFDWVRPWPGSGMYIHFVVLGVLAICIMLGLFYRVSTILFFFGITYVFLLDQTQYLNHMYLISLISFLLIFVPAHRSLSLDAALRPKIRSSVAPAWSLWLLRTQLGIVYFFGGIAKLNGDWLQGEPMRLWLAQRTDFPLIGRWFTEAWTPYLFSYGGLLFDLLFVPFVLWRRTRPFALLIAVIFHVTNSRLFSIGIFPWFMITANLLFLAPSWPRRLLRRKQDWGSQPTCSPALGVRQRAIVAAISIYLVVQVLVPLRHFLYPGDVRWTEQGHYFSWRMKLRDKEGEAQFFVTDPVNQVSWEVDPFSYINERQYEEMVDRPDMILQLAHHIANSLRSQGYAQIEVRAWVMVSLNEREPQLLIDPDVDLAAQPRSVLAAQWIEPLVTPLKIGQPSKTNWAASEDN